MRIGTAVAGSDRKPVAEVDGELRPLGGAASVEELIASGGAPSADGEPLQQIQVFAHPFAPGLRTAVKAGRPEQEIPRGTRDSRRWRDPDSNRGHHDFQSCALPTELSRRGPPA